MQTRDGQIDCSGSLHTWLWRSQPSAKWIPTLCGLLMLLLEKICHCFHVNIVCTLSNLLLPLVHDRVVQVCISKLSFTATSMVRAWWAFLSIPEETQLSVWCCLSYWRNHWLDIVFSCFTEGIVRHCILFLRQISVGISPIQQESVCLKHVHV